MKLTIVVPERQFLDVPGVRLISAESPAGSFELLEHHIDFVSLIVPGIVTYRVSGGERYCAVDEGALVKIGGTVTLSVRRAAAGDRLGELEETVRRTFRSAGKTETRSRAAFAKLEAGIMSALIELRNGQSARR